MSIPSDPVGRQSLENFLAHIVITAGTRIALSQAGVTDPRVHLAAGTALGVVVPLVLTHLARGVLGGGVMKGVSGRGGSGISKSFRPDMERASSQPLSSSLPRVRERT